LALDHLLLLDLRLLLKLLLLQAPVRLRPFFLIVRLLLLLLLLLWLLLLTLRFGADRRHLIFEANHDRDQCLPRLTLYICLIQILESEASQLLQITQLHPVLDKFSPLLP